MASTSIRSRCESCDVGIGLWQAAFTSECAHTFHLRCVSGSAACPVCAARWSDTPATGPAPTPDTPFSFASPSSSTVGMFGQPAAATENPFSQTIGLFGQPPSSTPNPFYTESPFSFRFPAVQPPNPFWLCSAPPSTQTPPCPVCHSLMGRGQATVTSECSHTFHLRCFSGSICPVCSARWRDEVTVAPPPPPPPSNTCSTSPPQSSLFQSSPSPLGVPCWQPPFNDDEPVERPLDGRYTVQEVASSGVLALKTHCVHPAVARDAARDNFAVLVHAKGPAAAAEASARAPLDLVTVLDVSGSMAGNKLALLKQAMRFVINNLGPGDRLGIVTFSSKARRVMRLTRMSDGGKASAKHAVESLAVEGFTNVGDGLRVAAEVLDGRCHRNPVASVILLSDGRDNCSRVFCGIGGTKSHIDLVPRSLRRSNDNRCPPVHTFGFGTDHDTAAMHAIAEVTGGTFSFIQNQAVVQDSFAQCIGGLLSVAAQEARVAVECLHPGVRIRAVKSGLYESRIDADGRTASVDVGELYAEEERRFLLFLDMPVAAEDGGVTRLIKASCTYRDAATGRSVDVACEDAAVQRPVVVAGTSPSVEVAQERFRVEAAEDIAAARAAAERGEHAKAAQILDRRREASAAAALAGDERCAELVAELRELSARVADRREYEQTGRACLLAGMSSHAQQRASTVQLFGAAASPFGSATPASPFAESLFKSMGRSSFEQPAPLCAPSGAPSASLFGALPVFGTPSTAAPAPRFGTRFATPAMQSMVESSRMAREQQQQSETATASNGGSLFGPK